MVQVQDVIGIFDASVKRSKLSAKLFDLTDKIFRTPGTEFEDIKSYVLTADRIYASTVSSVTLRKRAYFVEEALLPEFDNTSGV
ncbi:DUF370 domain-containing protein [Alicyclobacillaceae bacterium I2511]|nr:DUF370 domain-containing protein [Alicyclobacillaceae bacterium I2511]